MADTLIAPPPAATPPESAQPAQAAQTTIRAADMGASTATAPVKEGSKRQQMFDRLEKKAKPANDAVDPAVIAPSEPKPQPKPADKPETNGDETTLEPPTDAPVDKKGKKVSPWKLYDESKQRIASLEKELNNAKSAVVPEADRKTFSERIEKAEARAKELEDEIRYVNYSKSDEFKQKYQAPYEAAWKRAMQDLGELSIDPGNGQQRPVSAQDIATLVNLPLGEARKMANELYGDFADDVMGHRKEIRTLYDSQAQALEEAKKTGADREKQEHEKRQKTHSEISDHVKKTWEASNQKAIADEKYGKFFTPVEGDMEGNQRLAKGFELVDRAFNESPMDPRLTGEQRAAVVNRHAAVRNRAAAFGRLTHMVAKGETRIAELEKELAQYKAGEPTLGGDAKPTETNGAQWGNARQQMFDRLAKRAK